MLGHNTKVECIVEWHGVWGCSTWPPVTPHSPHHLKARTQCGGNSGHLLACFHRCSGHNPIHIICIQAMPSYLRIHEIGRRLSSSAIPKLSDVQELHLDSARAKKRTHHPVLGRPLLLFTSFWVLWKRDNPVWMIPSSAGAVHSNGNFNLQKTLHPLWPQNQKTRYCLF